MFDYSNFPLIFIISSDLAKSTISSIYMYIYIYIYDECIYLDSNISSTKTDVNVCLVKVRTAINRLSIIQKSDLPDIIKWNIF